jgi:hypothetical protein
MSSGLAMIASSPGLLVLALYNLRYKQRRLMNNKSGITDTNDGTLDQLLNKCPALYVSERFITAFTKD